MIHAYKFVNAEAGIASGGARRVHFHRREMLAMVTSDDWDVFCAFSISMKTLKLTIAELAVLVATNLTLADECDLQEPRKVEKLHWKLVCCLTYQLKKNHPGDVLLLPKVLSRLTQREHRKSALSWHSTRSY
ncbi:hypothetical protein ScPMuIL_014490 [Solemya velum]